MTHLVPGSKHLQFIGRHKFIAPKLTILWRYNPLIIDSYCRLGQLYSLISENPKRKLLSNCYISITEQKSLIFRSFFGFVYTFMYVSPGLPWFRISNHRWSRRQIIQMGYHCMVHLDQTGHHQFIHPHIIQYESHTFDISVHLDFLMVIHKNNNHLFPKMYNCTVELSLLDRTVLKMFTYKWTFKSQLQRRSPHI